MKKISYNLDDMKRILLAWIGMTDLRAAEGGDGSSLGPIGSVVAERIYDRIDLISNLDDGKNNPYIEWLGSVTDTGIRLHKVALTSPTEFGEIYKGVVGVIEGIREEFDGLPELTFHLSPGTPAMAAVWIILSKTRFPAELVESSLQKGVQTVSLPFDISAEFLPDLLRRPDLELERISSGAAPDDPAFEQIIHRSTVMKNLINLARRAAVRSVSILIEGESGTGKELMARAIHRASPRARKPFIPVNCGAIPSELVESELFGHAKGAFTGATNNKDGYFVKADGGTIFLDEIGELPLPAQVKLLRVLQEGEVTPVGSSSARKIDVRVISATNRTLIEEVAKGTFREDLFYRLAVFILKLPPVREREGDIGLLIDHLLGEVNYESEKIGIEHKNLSPGARNLLLNHTWPGNVREMKNTLLRAAVLSSAARIDDEDIRQAIFSAPARNSDQILNRPFFNGFNIQNVIEEVAGHYLQRAIAETHGNKSEAARLVGLPSYQTFTNWLKKYRIDAGT